MFRLDRERFMSILWIVLETIIVWIHCLELSRRMDFNTWL
jgi:hypothetical protein